MISATEYVRAGFALVELPSGSKGPTQNGWQLRQNAITTEARAKKINGHNIGLAHAWSTPVTCALDVDDFAGATPWLAARGIDLAALFVVDNSVQIDSGRSNRGKALYRLPEGVQPLQSKQVTERGDILFELRCSNSLGTTVQDVLPPSVHPDTGKPYEWRGDFRKLPILPPKLLALWQQLIHPEPASQRKPTDPAVAATADTNLDLRSALSSMRSDDRDLWVKIGMALKSLGEQGRALWLDWSQSSDKYDPADAARVWESFQPISTDYRAVFAEAKRHGWVNPAKWQRTSRRHTKSDVTDVTPVQASNDAGPGVTSGETPDVTDVTVSAPHKDRPCFKVFDANTDVKESVRPCKPGVWYFGIKPGGKSDNGAATLSEQWVCSPLHVEAVTSDEQDNNFGRLLRFRNTYGRERTWAMPMELLRGSGEELRGELLAMGVLIDPNTHKLLGQYLQSGTPERRVSCALQVGWFGNSFVLPDTVIGASSESVIFQSGERGHDEHTTAGTLGGWRTEIAARAIGNPLLVLALSAAFAGPMLGRCNAEGGGIHLLGDSSTGKTSLIDAACSVWGGANFRRSWRATANGMEGVAAMFNDCLLALDEISECDSREVGAIVYALGNGRGKQRASRTGTARSVTRWRCFVLSSGERSIATTMLDGGYRAKAGQGVRLLDLPASRSFGVYDDLCGFESGAVLSDAIRAASKTHYGIAGRAFLEKLTRDSRNFSEYLERVKALEEFAAKNGEGQDKRTAARFALIGMAGELATEYGVTEWTEGAAIDAAAEAFKLWRAQRGEGNDERRQILSAVSDFIERHGDARFSNAQDNRLDEPVVRDRAGWWTSDADVGGRAYLFTTGGMREALTGFEFRRALDILQQAGALEPPSASGERAKPERIAGRTARVYRIAPNKLEESGVA